MKTNHKSSQDRKVKKKKKRIKIVSDLGNGNPQKLIESNSKDREKKKKKTIVNTNPVGNKKFYKLIVTFIAWETFIAFP